MKYNINGITVYIYDTRPYFDICFTEENAKKYVEKYKLFANLDNMHQRAQVKIHMAITLGKFAFNNNWRKMHGFKKITQKTKKKIF